MRWLDERDSPPHIRCYASPHRCHSSARFRVACFDVCRCLRGFVVQSASRCASSASRALREYLQLFCRLVLGRTGVCPVARADTRMRAEGMRHCAGCSKDRQQEQLPRAELSALRVKRWPPHSSPGCVAKHFRVCGRHRAGCLPLLLLLDALAVAPGHVFAFRCCCVARRGVRAVCECSCGGGCEWISQAGLIRTRD